MILMLSTSIKLMPDVTFFWQLAIFLILTLSLNFLVFKPTIRLLNLRKEKTTELQKEAERLTSASEELQKEYEEKILKMREEGTFVQQEIIKQGKDLEKEIIDRAKIEAKNLIVKRKFDATKSAQRAKAELGTKTEEISKQIVSKLLKNIND